MGYATINQVQQLMHQALTSATSTDLDTLDNLINIGNTFDNNLITTATIEQYISWADDEINAAINELYRTPLCENADFETNLAADIDPYNATIVTEKACPFNPGDTILLAIDGDYERHEIDEAISRTVFTTVDSIVADYDAALTRLVRVRYPDPIPFVATRLSVANIFDRYFTAQSDPNVSEYGKHLRAMATTQLNNILNGRTILHGQHRIGEAFVSPYLKRRYSLPGTERYGQRDIEGSNT